MTFLKAKNGMNLQANEIDFKFNVIKYYHNCLQKLLNQNNPYLNLIDT